MDPKTTIIIKTKGKATKPIQMSIRRLKKYLYMIFINKITRKLQL